jgi:DNA polymerase III epsilon subunit-like protein
VEVAALLIERGRLTDEFEQLIDPECAIDRWSYNCHGISRAQVTGQPLFAQVWRDLRPMLRDAVVVAHNATFDAGVLRNELLRHRFDPPPGMRWWCTCKLARRVWPRQFPNYKLATLAQELALVGENTHRAAEDARLAANLLKRELDDAHLQGHDSLDRVEPLARQAGGKSWPF